MRLLLVDHNVRYAQVPGTGTLGTRIPSVDIVILPWETYIASSTNPCMVGSIKNVGAFKTYLCTYTNADILLN